MPKMKTNKSAAKRFRRTGKGKFKCGRAGKGHILTKKSRKRKRKLKKTAIVYSAEANKLKRLLPYG